jgi:hypothetical protein
VYSNAPISLLDESRLRRFHRATYSLFLLAGKKRGFCRLKAGQLER